MKEKSAEGVYILVLVKLYSVIFRNTPRGLLSATKLRQPRKLQGMIYLNCTSTYNRLVARAVERLA